MITYLLGVSILMYLFQSFEAWEFNPGNWSENDRAAIIGFSILLAAIISGLDFFITENFRWF